MELLGQDLYIIVEEKSLNAQQMAALTNVYMPLLSPLAVCLYLVLLKRPVSSQNYDSHLHLCETLQCSITKLQESRVELEQYLLLKTYVQSGQGQRLYFYETQYPLSVHSFLRHGTFARLLLNKMGSEYVERYSQEVLRLHQISDAQEITERLQVTMQDWTIDKEEFIRSTMNNLPNDKQEDPYNEYDIISYLKNNDPNEFMIPRSKISMSDVELVNSYGLHYQLNKEEMIKILHKCVNRSTGKLNKDSFIMACAAKSKVETKQKAEYSMHPLEFASCLLDGSLKSDEVKAIREIQAMYLFDNQTMNMIIETSIKNTEQHRVVPNYIATVAKNYTNSKKVDTEEVKTETKSAPKKKSTSRGYRRVGVVPDYEKIEQVPEVDPTKLKEKIDAIRKKRVM